MRKTIAVFLAVFVCLAIHTVTLSAGNGSEITISNVKISSGTAIHFLPPNAGAYCICTVSNPSSQPQQMILSVRSSNAKNADQRFDFLYTVPANKVDTVAFPMQCDGSPEYHFSVYPDTIRVIERVFTAVPPRHDETLYSLISDDPRHAGYFSKKQPFRGKTLVVTFPSNGIPAHTHVLETFRAIGIVRTNFKNWSSGNFDAVKEYVKNGGTLCFFTGDDVAAATRTPLKDLLPVTVDGQPTTRDLSGALKKFGVFPNAKPLPCTHFVLRKGAKDLFDESGLLVEWNCGKGKVRVSAFDITDDCIGVNTPYAPMMIRFLDGKQIPARTIQYHPLKKNSGITGGLPAKRTLYAAALLLGAGIIVLVVLGGIIPKKRKIFLVILAVYAVVVIVLAFAADGAALEWVPVENIFPALTQE